jgi:hypothetical protein
MPSKLGVHVNHITDADGIRDFILNARPAVVKTVHHDAVFWTEIKAEYPELLLIGRKYCERQPLSDPEGEAEDLVGWILDSSVTTIYDTWEGYNEVSRTRREGLYRFDRRMAEILHENGLTYVAGSWSVGVPHIPDWLEPGMLDVLRVADYIGVHEYCAPRMDSEFELYPTDPDIQPEVGGYFTLRYRHWYPTLPADCRKPLLITECGIDSGACHWDPGGQGGWRSFTDAEGYLEQLQWYDRYLREDDYVVGATIFCYGNLDPTWETYDIGGDAVGLLADYLVAGVEPPPPPPPPPPPDDGLEELQARIAELEEENTLLKGQLAAAQARIDEAADILDK